MSKRGHGETCTYCRRALEATTSPGKLAATRDHIIPRSKLRGAASVTVWACRFCNNLKADRTPEQWQRFMKRNPRWWEHPYYTGRPKPDAVSPERNRIKAPPIEKTRAFLKAASLRALEKSEPVPVEFDDPDAQGAFEQTYRDRKYLLRVPTPPIAEGR